MIYIYFLYHSFCHHPLLHHQNTLPSPIQLLFFCMLLFYAFKCSFVPFFFSLFKQHTFFFFCISSLFFLYKFLLGFFFVHYFYDADWSIQYWSDSSIYLLCVHFSSSQKNVGEIVVVVASLKLSVDRTFGILGSPCVCGGVVSSQLVMVVVVGNGLFFYIFKNCIEFVFVIHTSMCRTFVVVMCPFCINSSTLW